MVVVAADEDLLPVRTERNGPGFVSAVQFNFLFSALGFQVVDHQFIAPAIGKILAVGGEATGSGSTVHFLEAATLQLHDE